VNFYLRKYNGRKQHRGRQRGSRRRCQPIRRTEFWCDAPVAWFKSTEALFKLRGVTDENIKYSLLLTALPRAAFRKIEHLIGDDDDKPAADAYRQLKAALVSSHVLSNYQKVEMYIFRATYVAFISISNILYVHFHQLRMKRDNKKFLIKSKIYTRNLNSRDLPKNNKKTTKYRII
jgi:hypothetical protein